MAPNLSQIRDQLRTLLASVEELCAQQPAEEVPDSPPRGETRFPGIARHARLLGVSRVHLFLVLKGERKTRKSAALIKRYQTLLAKEGRTFHPAA